MPIDSEQLDQAIERTRQCLESNFIDGRYCEGHLSSSALSTAVSCIALKTISLQDHEVAISRSQEWLSQNVNEDGGWGDTVHSPSNISTSLLCWSALEGVTWEGEAKLESYLQRQLGEISPNAIVEKLKAIYGKDKTFAVPICMALAVSGRLGPEPKCWDAVDALPFELAAAPQNWYQYLKLNVVSYAIPALISIGILKHKKGSSWFPLSMLRSLLVNRCLDKLMTVQPSHGGFLEAVPLTGFTAMALHSCGYGEHAVTKKALCFLLESIREDGSSPIDTNLSGWVTSLSLQVLESSECQLNLEQVMSWVVEGQWQHKDPYAGAEPGAWAWTPLPGGVPDADDTSGALLALLEHGYQNLEVLKKGVLWLVHLQNQDGGIPTFCRGWGQLPFDQSCTDITAHALRAFQAFQKYYPNELKLELEVCSRRAMDYIKRMQKEDGSWLPLWFGSQDHPNKENPVYGTSKVLLSLSNGNDLDLMREKGFEYLVSVQREDGSFGGHLHGNPSIEETALAARALCTSKDHLGKCEKAIVWLMKQSQGGRVFPDSPIGLYFASLWYSEKMYPIIFALDAFQEFKKRKD